MLEHKVQYCSPEAVVSYLKEFGAHAVTVLARGVCGPVGSDARKSFAAHCLRQGKVETWRAVVSENFGNDDSPAAALERTVSIVRGPEMLNAIEAATTPSEAAVLAASPEGLSMVLELDPSTRARQTTLSGEVVESLHHLALVRMLSPESYHAIHISSARSPDADLRQMLACCERLLLERAPWAAAGDNEVVARGSAHHQLTSIPWPSGEGSHALRELLGRYVDAGMLSLKEPIRFGYEHVIDGLTPLGAAGLNLNLTAVEALIEMGCTIEGAVPKNSKHTNLLDYLRSSRRDGAEQCLAAATAAILRRGLGASHSEASEAASHHPRRRVGL